MAINMFSNHTEESIENERWMRQAITLVPEMQALYFARFLDYVKIGRTSNPRLRLYGIGNGLPEDLTPMAIIPYMGQHEEECHERLTHLNSKGEWFHYTSEVDELIKEMQVRYKDFRQHLLMNKIDPDKHNEVNRWIAKRLFRIEQAKIEAIRIWRETENLKSKYQVITELGGYNKWRYIIADDFGNIYATGTYSSSEEFDAYLRGHVARQDLEQQSKDSRKRTK